MFKYWPENWSKINSAATADSMQRSVVSTFPETFKAPQKHTRQKYASYDNSQFTHDGYV